MPKIRKVIDHTDNYYTKIDKLFDLPMRLICVGKSQLSGKTTIILNLLLNEDFNYRKYFKGEDMYIISNNKLDNKLRILMEEFEVPSANYMPFNEYILDTLYDELEDKFIDETTDGGKPRNRIIVFDDVAYSGQLKDKQAGILTKILMNGRHLNLSSIITSQKFSLIQTGIRSNVSGAILFNTNAKELELIADDFNYYDNKKDFIKLFRETTKEKNSFMVVNFSNDNCDLYMNSEFEPIRK